MEKASGDAGELAVRQGQQRFLDGGWRLLSCIDQLRPFHATPPAIVAAGLDPVDGFPELPSHITHPQGPIRAEGRAPRIAKPIGPNLGQRSLATDERVPGGDGKGIGARGSIHIDAENAAQAIVEILPREQHIRRLWRGRVARGNVQKPIRTELERTAVVSPAHPSQQDLFARGLHPRRVGGFHAETAQAGSSRIPILNDIDQIQESVGGKSRMEGESEGLSKGAAKLAQIEGHIGGGGLGPRNEGNQSPANLQHPQSGSRRVEGQFDRILELQLGKHAIHLGHGRRLWGSLNPT